MIKPRNAVDLDVPAATPLDATVKERSVFQLDAPSATEPTVKDRSRAVDLEATTKERRAADLDETTIKERDTADRHAPRAASLEPTSKERSAAERHVPPAASFEPTMKERSAADRHVPPAASFEPTMKERSAADRRVPPGSGWLTWWLTARPHASSSPAAPSIVPLDGTSTRGARPRITRSARTWIVITALIVASVGGTVAILSRSTNDATHRDASGGSR